MTYFDLYEIPEAFFNPEGFSLKRKFLELSRKYHPDFHTESLNSIQDSALDYSSLNNKAYEVLKDDHKRLAYVLEINNQLAEGENKEALPSSFLMEMMEVNEALMELEFDFDQAAFDKLQSNISLELQSLWSETAPVLKEYVQGDVQTLLTAKNYLFKRRYLLRIQEKMATFAVR